MATEDLRKEQRPTWGADGHADEGEDADRGGDEELQEHHDVQPRRWTTFETENEGESGGVEGE